MAADEHEPFLPGWATLDEAEAWLSHLTGEGWSLPRLLQEGIWPSVWLEPSPDDLKNPEIMGRLFGGRTEGFLAALCFAGDTHRLAVDRTVLLTITRNPAGELVRFTPGLACSVTELRFPADQLRTLAQAFADRVRVDRDGPILKRDALIARHERAWPTIRADLREASRNGLNRARAEQNRGWLEGVAVKWAVEKGKYADAAAASPFGRVHRIGR